MKDDSALRTSVRPPSQVLTFAYVSRVSPRLSRDGFVRLIAEITQNNRLLDIRGLLFYRANSFKQVIEGAPPVISGVIARILTDQRHTDIEVLSFQTNAASSFNRWHYVGFESFGLPEPLRPPPPTDYELAVERTILVRGDDRGA